MNDKKFNEELEKIRNYKELSEVSKIFDFMLDYEQIYLESCITTGYKHKRNTDFTDEQIIALAEALEKKTNELLEID